MGPGIRQCDWVITGYRATEKSTDPLDFFFLGDSAVKRADNTGC